MTEASEGRDRNYWNLMSRGKKYIFAHTCQDDPVVYESRGEQDAMKLAAMVPDCAGLTVLDWGCGAGRVTTFLDTLFKKVVAVDISQGMMAIARATDPVRTEFQLIRVNKLNLSDQSVDVVYSFATWMHLPRKGDLGVVLGECRRILIPGGRCVFQLPVYESGGSERPAGSPGGVAHWNEAELKALLAPQGWTIADLRVSPGAPGEGGPPTGPHHFAVHEIRSKVG